MSNPKDFLARQIRTNSLILSGGNWAKDAKGGTPGLLIYTASLAPDFVGTRPDKFRSGSSKYGMVQIVQSEMTPSGGFAIQDIFGGNVRIVLEEPITPAVLETRRHTANFMLGTLTDVAGAASSSVASNFITVVSGNVGGRTGQTPRVFILSQSINGEANTKTDNAVNNPLRMLDVNFFVSGSKGSKRRSGNAGASDAGNGDCGTALFGGDVVISGTLYAEKQVIEVDISQSGSLYVSGSAEIGGGLVVNEHGGSEAIEWRNRDSNNFLYYAPSGGGNDGTLGIGDNGWSSSNLPLAPLHIADENSTTNSASTQLIIDQKSTGTPADGLGVSIVLRAENDANALHSAVSLEGILSDVSNGSEDGAFIVKTMTAGVNPTEKFRVGSTETVVNEDGLDHDFRIQGDNTNMLFRANAGNDMVEIQGPTDDTDVFRVSGHDDNGNVSAILLKVNPTEVSVNESANTVNFRVEGKNKPNAILVKSEVVSGHDQVLILSGGGTGGATDSGQANGTDINFYVSGSTGTTAGRGIGDTYGTALFGGDLHASGNITADGRVGPWVDGGTFVYPFGTEHLVLGASTIAAADIILASTGSATFNNQSSANGDFRVKSQNDEAVIFVDASLDVVGIGTDIPDTSAKLHVGNSGNSSNQAALVLIESENASSADALISFAKQGTVKNSIGMDDSNADRLKIAIGGTLGAEESTLMGFPTATGNPIVVNEDNANIDFRIEGQNDESLFVADASTNSIGINVAAGSHGARLDILENDASAKGLLVTVNPGSAATGDDVAKFVSGSSEVFSVGMSDVVVNEAGGSRDFRVESANNVNMLVVKGSTDRVGIGTVSSPQATLHLKESAPTFRIQRSSNSNNSTIEFVGSAGATANMVHLGSTNDLVFSTHDGVDQEEILRLGAYYGSSNRQVILLSGTAMAADAMQPKNSTDINFFVSGAIGSRGSSNKGTAVFGGDLVVSGGIFDGSGNNLTNNYGKFAVLDTGGSVEGTAEASGIADTFKIKEGTGIGLSIDTGADTVTISANIGTASPAFTDRGFQTGHVENHRGTSIICTSSISFVSGNHIDGISPVAYDASNIGTDTFFFVSGSIGGKAAAAAHRHGVAVFGGDALVSGSFYTEGNTTLGDATTDTITFNARAGSHFLPAADSTYNLGSPALRFANIYTGDLHLRNERGDWTIYEEPDMLVVVNNKTGKKYKMGLTPLEDEE